MQRTLFSGSFVLLFTLDAAQSPWTQSALVMLQKFVVAHYALLVPPLPVVLNGHLQAVARLGGIR